MLQAVQHLHSRRAQNLPKKHLPSKSMHSPARSARKTLDRGLRVRQKTSRSLVRSDGRSKSRRPGRRLSKKDSAKPQQSVTTASETSVEKHTVAQSVTTQSVSSQQQEQEPDPASAEQQFDLEDLAQELEANNGRLRALVRPLEDEKKQIEQLKILPAETKSLVLPSFLKAGEILKSQNKLLKEYIDGFILTKNVLDKYEEFVKARPHYKSSNNDILQFMTHTYRNVGLRKNEQGFFDASLHYTNLLSTFYSFYIYESVDNASVKNFEHKIMLGTKLALFVKQYMAIVGSLKDDLNYLEYENMDNLLYPSTTNRSSPNRKHLVYKEGHKNPAPPAHVNQQNSMVPIKIIIGNDEYGQKQSKKIKPSDVIEVGAEFHPDFKTIPLENVPDEDRANFILKRMAAINHVSPLAAKSHRQQEPGPDINEAEGLVNQVTGLSQQLDKMNSVVQNEETINQKLEEENRKLNKLVASQSPKPILKYNDPLTGSLQSNDRYELSLQAHNSDSRTQQTQTTSAVQSSAQQASHSASMEDQLINSFLWKDNQSLPVMPHSVSDIKQAHTALTSSQLSATQQLSAQPGPQANPRQAAYTMPNGIVYDQNHLPMNLEIYRAPFVEKIDSKYVDTVHSFGDTEATNYGKIHENVKEPKSFYADYVKKMNVEKMPVDMENIWALKQPKGSTALTAQSSQENSQVSQVQQRSDASGSSAPQQRYLELQPGFANLPMAPDLRRHSFANSFDPSAYYGVSGHSARNRSSLAHKTDAIYRDLLNEHI